VKALARRIFLRLAEAERSASKHASTGRISTSRAGSTRSSISGGFGLLEFFGCGRRVVTVLLWDAASWSLPHGVVCRCRAPATVGLSRSFRRWTPASRLSSQAPGSAIVALPAKGDISMAEVAPGAHWLGFLALRLARSLKRCARYGRPGRNHANGHALTSLLEANIDDMTRRAQPRAADCWLLMLRWWATPIA